LPDYGSRLQCLLDGETIYSTGFRICPVGTDDGSQAIYCLGYNEKANRPVGNGVMVF